MNKTEYKIHKKNGIKKIKSLWLEIKIFEKFEYWMLMFVSLILAIIILVAFIRLAENVFYLFLLQFNSNTKFTDFQTTFGMLLTLLIAFEFRNSINAMLEGKGLLVQAKIILLIAIIALARKFLVLDPKAYDTGLMIAYAAIALSLGIIYWLLSYKKLKIKEPT